MISPRAVRNLTPCILHQAWGGVDVAVFAIAHSLPVSCARQRLEKEERERKRLEKMRLKEEEKMKEEIDLYERGLSAR